MKKMRLEGPCGLQCQLIYCVLNMVSTNPKFQKLVGFLIMDFNPILSGGKFFNHDSAKYKLVGCCLFLKCWVKRVSNSFVIMQLIEGRNHTNSLHDLLY
jgi:hypothetical protein